MEGKFEGPRAKALLAKLTEQQREEVLKIHKAMEKKEAKNKYHFPKKTENKEGGKGKKKVKAKKTKAKKTKAKK